MIGQYIHERKKIDMKKPHVYFAKELYVTDFMQDYHDMYKLTITWLFIPSSNYVYIQKCITEIFKLKSRLIHDSMKNFKMKIHFIQTVRSFNNLQMH